MAFMTASSACLVLATLPDSMPRASAAVSPEMFPSSPFSDPQKPVAATAAAEAVELVLAGAAVDDVVLLVEAAELDGLELHAARLNAPTMHSSTAEANDLDLTGLLASRTGQL
jgi:hypothetical protein